MKGALILLGVLAALWLVGQLRLGLGAEYSAKGLYVWAYIGPGRISVFPFPKSKKKSEPNHTKKRRTPRAEKPKMDLAEQIGGALDYAKGLLPILLEAAGKIRSRIRVDKLRLKVNVGAADPADAAIRYGQANGALGALWGTLNEAFDLRDGQAGAAVDFDARETTVYILAMFSLRLSQMAWLGLYFGCKGLRTFLQIHGRRKQEQQQRKAV